MYTYTFWISERSCQIKYAQKWIQKDHKRNFKFRKGLPRILETFALCYLWSTSQSIPGLFLPFHVSFKVIETKYSKHWPYIVAQTFDCVCSKINNSWFKSMIFILLFKLMPCPIHWMVCLLAYLNFILEF